MSDRVGYRYRKKSLILYISGDFVFCFFGWVKKIYTSYFDRELPVFFFQQDIPNLNTQFTLYSRKEHYIVKQLYSNESCSVTSDSLWPHGLYSPWNSPGQNTGVGNLSVLQGIFPAPGIEPRSPALQADSLPAEPPGKPKNTGLGSLSLLQGNFPKQGSNLGLLHHRRILYQLSYEGSPYASRNSLNTFSP